jgi:hypothetical protein
MRVTDETSGVVVLDLTMSVEAFGYALTGLAMQECQFQVFGQQAIGKVRETKTELIVIKSEYAPKAEQVIEKYNRGDVQVEGWTLSLTKMQRVVSREMGSSLWSVEVPFVRYVDKVGD